MPSGLTYKINSGEDMTLRGFALKCVTQLGAGYFATEQGIREMPLYEAPVLKISDYHQKNLDKSKDELEYWKKIKENPTQLKQLYDEYCEKSINDNAEIKEERETIKQRYLTMREKVEKWNVPDEYNSLKELMLKQLNDSMDFDCPESTPQDKLPTIDEWIECRIDSCLWSINYHTKELAKEKKHITEINLYLSGLYDEIDKVEPHNNKEK